MVFTFDQGWGEARDFSLHQKSAPCGGQQEVWCPNFFDLFNTEKAIPLPSKHPQLVRNIQNPLFCLFFFFPPSGQNTFWKKEKALLELNGPSNSQYSCTLKNPWTV